MTTEVDIEHGSDVVREAIEHRLAQLWSDEVVRHPQLEPFIEAIRYSLLAPGKRIRPQLTFAAAHVYGCSLTTPGLLDAALACELVHAYSLVHDDLPCMDDDDLRRGRPTSHRQFDEGTAVLVGDALQTAAFEMLANDLGQPAEVRIALVAVLARAAGWSGMAGGQYLDLQQSAGDRTASSLQDLHARKTGALIAASLEIGAIVGGASNEEREIFRTLGGELGELFQAVDDLLDEIGDETVTGKPSGTDRRHGKHTSVSELGIDALRDQADAQMTRCLELASQLPHEGGTLRDMVRYVRFRDR